MNRMKQQQSVRPIPSAFLSSPKLPSSPSSNEAHIRFRRPASGCGRVPATRIRRQQLILQGTDPAPELRLDVQLRFPDPPGPGPHWRVGH